MREQRKLALDLQEGKIDRLLELIVKRRYQLRCLRVLNRVVLGILGRRLLVIVGRDWLRRTTIEWNCHLQRRKKKRGHLFQLEDEHDLESQ